ncbi:MAG: SH3 beta-barrel fold-containing protein [Bacteroidales bacterium]|nr:SH3 beta-barrel fold-containing protein [Bacteroidales bacterium]
MKTFATTATSTSKSTNKSNFRARIMKYAWQIWRAAEDGTTWKWCMKQAWRLYYLAKAMRQGEVRFTYLKADGTIRFATGTLKNLPAGITMPNGKKLTKPSYKAMAYFDTEKNAFRSFKVENFLAMAI